MEGMISNWIELSGRRQMVIAGSLMATLLLVLVQIATTSVHPTNAVLLLFLLTLLVTQTFGVRAGLLCAVAADLILVYFFFSPIFVFWAHDIQLRITLGLFLMLSVFAGAALRDSESNSNPGLRGIVRKQSRPQQTVLEPVRAQAEEDLHIDVDRHIVLLDGKELALTPTEFTLLLHFVGNAGRILSHQSILAAVWGDEYMGDTQILRTYVKQLRAKLGDQSSSPRFIRTEARLGYRFIP